MAEKREGMGLRRLTERPRALVGRMLAGEDSGPDTKRPMAGRLLVGLVLYLTVLGFVAAWTAWTLWTARPPAAVEETWPAAVAPAADTAAPPVIDTILPSSLAFGIDLPAMRVFGTGFNDASGVLLDGLPASAIFIPPNQMRVTLTEADFRQSRSVAVTVTRGTASSAPVPVRIESDADAILMWSPPLLPASPISAESRLLLLAVLLGGLGGMLASFNSLSSYRGEGRLTTSWFLHYWVSPVLGGGVALFLYIVVRAGFLAGTEVRVDGGATPWGLVAVSALAGLFYDKTLLKLREVFITLFAPKDDRSAKLVGDGEEEDTELRITTTELEPATVGQSYQQALEVAGGEEPYSFAVRPELPGGLLLDPMTGMISGQPTEQQAPTPYEFTLRDMQRTSAGVSLELEVKGP